MAVIIDGKQVSEEILKKLKLKYDKLNKKLCLNVITVGEDSASKVYVRNKKRHCEKFGIEFVNTKFDENISEEKLIREIKKINKDDNINGVLIQLPLPKHLNQIKIISNIDPKKDVDGFHPENIGYMFLDKKAIRPCTAIGVVELLKFYNIKIEGSDVLIIGRSNIVGKPLMNMLVNMSATVQIAHSKTVNLDKKIQNADIIICAVGKHGIINNNHKFKKNVCIIDVGINIINGKIYGDVDFENVSKNENVGYISKVPGGVGPMTITYLINNLIQCYDSGIIDN